MKLTGDDLRTIALFESVTGARVIDMVAGDDANSFLIAPAGAGKAIGKGAENIKRFQEITGKRANVFVHHADEKRFVMSLLHRYNVESVEVVEERGKKYANVRIAPVDKARAIGRNGRNIKMIADLARRHSKIDGIRIE